MASRIQKFMNDLGFRTESMPPLIYHKITYFLKGFDTLVVCSRTLGEDARLTPLLTRIDQVFTRNAEIVELHGRGGFHAAIPVDLIHDFGADLKSLEVEMDEWYTTLSNSPHLRSPTLIDVIEIIDSVLEDLQNFHRLEFSDIGDDSEGMEEKLQLFRNFIEFVEMLIVDEQQQLEAFVIQVASVAVNAAHVCARLHGLFDAWNAPGWKQVKHGWKQIQPQILALLQRIRPVGVEVSQAYRTALSISKSSEELRYSMDLDPALYSLVVVIKDFIDFLLWCLWETLELDYCLDDSMKDTVRPLWGGLKFFREQLIFDEEIIRMAICNAGIVIFSLHHQGSGVADLVKKFDVIMIDAEDRISESSRLDIKVEAEERIAETSRLKSDADLLPPTAVLRFFNCLLDSLMESKNFDDLKTVKQDLVYLTSSLNLLMELGNQQAEDFQVQLLWNGAKKVAVSCKTLWDHMEARNIPYSVLQLVDSISKDISIFRENFSAVYPGRRLEASEGISGDIQDGFMITESIRTRQADTSQIMPEIRPQCSVLATGRVAGITEEVTSILDELTGSSKYLHITPIVGMAGLGKTTLALQLYNHPSVIHHFQCRAWCTVSQVYSINKLLLELLYQIHPDWFSVYITMKDEYLVNQIQQFLTSKRYLVCLDDVWDLTAWKCLKECFPDKLTGSRILVTSRARDVIPRSMLCEHYLLRHRSDFESLEILKTMLFPEDDFPVILHELGMQIAESCKGLPMTIVAVAGLLTTPEPEVWKKVLESLNSNALSITQQFINSFEFSYRHLSVHLKLCFLYFSMFQEGEEVSTKSLYLLWIAEGLIYEDKWNKSDDIAIRYMEDFVTESLVIVTKRSDMGEVKTCRVHEIIHAFCIEKAKEEAFSHFLKGYDDILAVNELRGSQRLCIQSSRRDFKSLRLSRPNIQSLLFFPLKDALPRVVDDVSFIVRVFKSLRVLHIREMDLGEVFPVEMKLLVELRYLAVRGHFVNLPSSIGNLSNLETLIVDAHLEISLPSTIRDLHKLRHLFVKNGFSFSSDDSSELLQLERCSVVIAESWDILEMLLRKFPNVINLKLKCRHQLAGAPALSRQIKLTFASNLQRLTLKDLELNDSWISAVGTLPCLERLKLLHVSFCGGGLHMKEENNFSGLKYFKLSDSNILSWTATKKHQLPYLEKLVLKGCPCLEEIPTDCLKFGPFLQEIEVFDCSKSVELQVREIEKDPFRSISFKVTISGIPTRKDLQ